MCEETQLVEWALSLLTDGFWEIIQENKAKEMPHFEALPKIDENELKPGDILLKKDYDGKSPLDSPVVVGQFALDFLESAICKAENGSIFSSHALIHLGEGTIAESTNHKKGVWIGHISEYNEKGLLVHRCNNEGAIMKAVELANNWATDGWRDDSDKKAKISYSLLHCIMTTPCNSVYGYFAKNRAKKAAKGKIPSDEMMCSEFVTYCYQATQNPSIELDAQHTAPIRLEHYLNTNENFELIGRVVP